MRYPSYASKEMNNFIQLLLEKNGPKRLQNALGIIENENENENGIDSESVIQNGVLSKGICYDYLRNHDFFKLGCRCVTYLNSVAVALLCLASLLCFSLVFALLCFASFCFFFFSCPLLYFPLSICLRDTVHTSTALSLKNAILFNISECTFLCGKYYGI